MLWTLYFAQKAIPLEWTIYPLKHYVPTYTVVFGCPPNFGNLEHLQDERPQRHHDNGRQHALGDMIDSSYVMYNTMSILSSIFKDILSKPKEIQKAYNMQYCRPARKTLC